MTRLSRTALLAMAVAAASPSLRVAARVGATAQMTSPRAAPVRLGTAVIRGVVVDGTTGAPMRRAAVSLVIEAPDLEGSHVVATTADAAGQF
ncbi:MAG TPA: hypothetical protein VMW48_02545, partial [Vicinamibacterales bacterium]|nr:hypothetical protein [Vicinamibacterales bacterium]